MLQLATRVQDDIVSSAVKERNSPAPQQAHISYGSDRKDKDTTKTERKEMMQSLDLASMIECTPTVPDDIIADEDVEAAANEQKQRSSKSGRFRDMGYNIPRDDNNLCLSNEEIVRRMNEYDYTGSTPGRCAAVTLTCLTMGMYYAAKRHVVPDGKFGHYISSGRHMLTMPGIHVLFNTTETWIEELDMNDAKKTRRTFGSKTFLRVPENHLAGAFRIGRVGPSRVQMVLDEEKASKNTIEDGQFVLFGQGRHVFSSAEYQDIEMVSLEDDIIPLGPITILYVKEGYLGGAYRRNEGIYEVLYPGAPYLLHKEIYEDVKLVQQTIDPYRLGPLHFVTVCEGFLGGAYHKLTGRYQILPPGHTYRLHSREYEAPDLIERTTLFSLGPYNYITVKRGWVAGAYRKKGGEFIILPPGQTYQLNNEEFETPINVKRDKHRVTCGPYTFLTLEKGTLNGAFRICDGQFVEFTDVNKQYKLHEKEYTGLVTIDKYSFEEQKFGPNKVITIADGCCGVFEHEGKLQIKESGFYKLPSEYRIRGTIPMNMQTTSLSELEFKTKDGIEMNLSCTMNWTIVDPGATALLPKAFDSVDQDITRRLTTCLIKAGTRHNREQLLPTRQDVLIRNGMNLTMEEIDDKMESDTKKLRQLYEEIQAEVTEAMSLASESCGWGVKICSTALECFELMDTMILQSLSQMTQTIMAKATEKSKGQLAIARAEATKATRIKEMEADKVVTLEKARVDGEARLIATQKENECAVLLAQTKAEAEARALEIKSTAENKIRIATAEAEAQAIHLKTEVEHERARKMHKAEAMMSEKKFQLKMSELAVAATEKIGSAAWRMPDKVQQFYHLFAPYLRVGGNHLPGTGLPADKMLGMLGVDALPSIPGTLNTEHEFLEDAMNDTKRQASLQLTNKPSSLPGSRRSSYGDKNSANTARTRDDSSKRPDSSRPRFSGNNRVIPL